MNAYRTLADMPPPDPVAPKEHPAWRLGLLLFLLAGPVAWLSGTVLAGVTGHVNLCGTMATYVVPAYFAIVMYVSEARATNGWSDRRRARFIAWAPVTLATLLSTLAWRQLVRLFVWVRDGGDG